MRQPRRDASFRGAPKGTSSTMVSQGCMREDKKAAPPTTWPQPGRNRERNQCHPPGVLSFVRQVATNAVYRPTFTGRLARLLWGKSNGGMGLGQDHWKKASPGPRRLPCDASRNAEPHCAAQSAHRELRKIGCLGTGRAKGRCGGRSRIARPWNCRQRLKFTRLIFFDIRGDVRKAFSVGSTCRMNASQPQK